MLLYKGMLFITPARTGSTSLEKFFEDFTGEHDNSVDAENVRLTKKHHTFITNKYEKYKKVLLVRNPYERFVSYYYWTKQDKFQSINDYVNIFKQVIDRLNPYLDLPVYEISSFIKKNKLNYLDNTLQMFRPLSSYMYHVKPDVIVHLETITEDLSVLGIDTTAFPHANASLNRPQKSAKELLTKEALDILNPILAEEATLLGYPVLRWDEASQSTQEETKHVF